MSRRKHGRQARGLLFTALSRRAGADLGDSAQPNLRGMLLAAFGASPRDPARPNTRAAAQGLGVSARTVNRWLARPDQQHTAPRADTFQRIRSAAQAAARTRTGRAAAIAEARSGPLAKRGLSITVRGLMGPTDDPDYTRNRKAVWNLRPPHAEGLFDAYEKGGENGALKYLSENAELYSMDTWWFGEVSGFDINPLYGGD